MNEIVCDNSSHYCDKEGGSNLIAMNYHMSVRIQFK